MSAIKQKEKNVAVLRVRNSRLKSKSFNSACILLLGTVTQSLASAPMKSTVNENDIRESTHQIVRINISECVRQSFTYLMPDRHLEKYMMNDFNFRRRSYGTGKFKNKSFSWDSETPAFTQTGTKNEILESLKKRKFESIESDIREHILSEIIMPAYSHLPQVDYSVGVHQIRIISNTWNQGKPTPEGIHHDGVDYVSVACVDTVNVSGGISFVLSETIPRHIYLEKTLSPGDLLIFDDRPVAHYVSDITPKLPGFAHRDVIVTTFETKSLKATSEN